MTTPNKGIVDPELKTALAALREGIAAAAPASKLIALQAQVDAIDVKLATRAFGDSSFGTGSTLLKTIQENESVHRLLKDRRGTAVLHLKGAEYSQLMDRKNIISSTATGTSEGDTLNAVGTATTGVLQIDRIPGITPRSEAGAQGPQRLERTTDHDERRGLREGYESDVHCVAGARSEY